VSCAPASLLFGASGRFLIAPNAGILIWTVMAMILVTCGAVTAAKGRWGWLIAGLVTAGILWVAGALQPARPTSAWSRISTARHARG
jgi:hypothetical protein